MECVWLRVGDAEMYWDVMQPGISLSAYLSAIPLLCPIITELSRPSPSPSSTSEQRLQHALPCNWTSHVGVLVIKECPCGARQTDRGCALQGIGARPSTQPARAGPSMHARAHPAFHVCLLLCMYLDFLCCIV